LRALSQQFRSLADIEKLKAATHNNRSAEQLIV
jgi:hypothetical protein